MNSFPSASLYVGDLHPEVTEGQLFEVFNVIGPVASIRVCRDAITRRSLGYAYVNYHNVADAERALDTLNNTPIKGRVCRIMWSQRDPSVRKSGVGNVFIKNLDKSIDHRGLYDTFSAFGNILSCKVVMDDSNQSKGYGFVHFETQEQADKAINRVNEMVLNGKQVFVGPFIPKKERMRSGDSNKFTNVFVKNLDETMSESELNDMFSAFGVLKNCVIMKDENGKSKGFGFVNFENFEDAKKAVDDLNDKEVKGKKVFCARAQKKAEREAELKAKFEQVKAERMAKYQGVNLYVKNLDDDWDEEKLKTEFGQFGAITSCKVMRDEKNASRGFGFVCFVTPEEATRAVSEMNGRMVGAKPLYVAMAQRKEIRRAQLEAQMQQRMKRGGIANVPAGPAAMYAAGNPVFYAQPPNMPPQQFMYAQPQHMISRRWPGPGQYQPVPPNYVVQMQRQTRVNGRQLAGRRFQQTRGGRDQGNQGQVAAQQAGVPQAMPGMEALTMSTLAQFPPEQQLNMVGERLFSQISKAQPDLAGKVTGMLLERYSSSIPELVDILNNEAELTSNVDQALDVLNKYAKEQSGEKEEN
eukprot:CAMPEP_0177645174 /NCGR_PEP_ID=MMETSP0447-20121125/9108_1 /TAXON_ID=0 /ORGANISM="Stygamoeba regulata, Strain BSH-02190019" /LENGTH=581 /DNA_ID=CAMNT_0019147639 /DNA_START=164 /DNA_END=1909 /DNA_ORIENTATION=+